MPLFSGRHTPKFTVYTAAKIPTGYNLVPQFSLSAKTVRLIWLLPICPRTRFFSRLLYMIKWLPAESIRLILHPTETFGRKHSYADSLSRKPVLRTVVLKGSKKSRTVSTEAKYVGQFRREAITGGLVFTL